MTSATTASPRTARRSMPALRVFEHQFLAYRRIWKSNVVGAVVRPLMYVLGMGLGVGSLVDDGPRSSELLAGLSYFEFFAPAIIATTAMLVLTNDSLWPVRGGFVWFGTYLAQNASPIEPRHIASGVLLWHVAKGLLTASGVAVVLALFEATRTWGLIPAALAGALAGSAYSAPLVAWSAQQDSDLSYPNVMRFVIVPMFLFSGAFYPVSQLPAVVEIVAKLTPIWHGVELTRGATHGTLSGSAIVHVAYLLAWWIVGWKLSQHIFTKKLRV